MANKIGIYGFRKNGVDKVTCVTIGGGIDRLGKAVLEYCQRNFAMDLIFDRIEMLDAFYKETEEMTAEWGDFSTEGVLERLELAALTKGTAHMRDKGDLLFDGAFHCAYIINLDKEMLEFWTGYQYRFQGNRYNWQRRVWPYSRLIAEFPIKEIADGGPSGISGFVQKMKAAEKQDKEGE